MTASLPIRGPAVRFQFILSKAFAEHFPGCHKLRQRSAQINACHTILKQNSVEMPPLSPWMPVLRRPRQSIWKDTPTSEQLADFRKRPLLKTFTLLKQEPIKHFRAYTNDTLCLEVTNDTSEPGVGICVKRFGEHFYADLENQQSNVGTWPYRCNSWPLQERRTGHYFEPALNP